MSEPKRYALRLPDISYGTEEAHNGEYVRYSDYARLKAEVRKLTTERDANLVDAGSLFQENARLKAEVERLTKAGDEMDLAISSVDPQRSERHRFMRLTDAEYLAVVKWRTAKDPNYIRG